MVHTTSWKYCKLSAKQTKTYKTVENVRFVPVCLCGFYRNFHLCYYWQKPSGGINNETGEKEKLVIRTFVFKKKSHKQNNPNNVGKAVIQNNR